MSINADEEIDVDLVNLESVPLVRAIQELLRHYSSDTVREHMRAQRVSIDHVMLQRDDASFSKQDLLDSPFFIIKNLNPLPTVQNAQHQLSGNVSTTARRVLDDFYGFNVTFDKWNDFDAVMNAQDITSLGKLPAEFWHWGDLIKRLLLFSSAANMRSETGEVQELTMFHRDLGDVFAAFDFEMKVKNGSDDDVTCMVISTKEEFLFSEGKESSCLPRFLLADGHRLCSFGFATKLARVLWQAPPTAAPQDWHEEANQNNELRAGLQSYLQVGGTTPKETSVQPSERTNAVLRNPENTLKNDVEFVHAEFAANRIEPHDPVNLWAAVMQACIYSVRKGRVVTVVQSVRMWWFIKLDVTNCTVQISTAKVVGSDKFLETVIKFLSHARHCPTMETHSRRRWERAVGLTDRRSAATPGKRTAAPAGTATGRGKSGAKRRRQSSSSGKKRPSIALTDQANSCEASVVSFDSMDNEETVTDSYFGYDKYGMAIPWFDQIGDTIEVLGRGRSGEVTKVVWNSRLVALKTFVLRHDDSRSLKSVYEHELEVLWSLRKLWGKHVPELLFHKPWPTSPMIGLELGESLPDDMSKWSAAELKQADETIQKIRELGWEQMDDRGSNFVRLKRALEGQEDRIAMIDFESLERVT